MRRRSLLAVSGAALSIAASGCVDRVVPVPTDDGEENGSNGPSDDDTDTGQGGDHPQPAERKEDDTVTENETDTDETDGTTTDDSETDPAGTPPEGQPPLIDATLSERDCESPGEASIDVRAGDREIQVRGCVVGNTGCHIAAIEAADYGSGGPFRIVVAAIDDSGPDELCTQVLTERGYLITARFDGGVPDRLEVVHDDVNGRATVAERSI